MKKIFLMIFISLLLTGCKVETIVKNEVNIIFEDQEFLYDGIEKSIYITEVPKNYDIIYYNNNQIEVGSYIVEAHLTCLDDIYDDIIVKANLVIYEEINFDIVYDSYFNNTYLEYNGLNQSIYLNNEELLILNGFNVEYVYDKVSQINCGIYEIKAIITKDDFIYEVESFYEIHKKNVTVNFTGNTLYFEDEEINLIVEDYNASYIYYDEYYNIIDKPNKVGIYYIEAIFNEENYEIENIYIRFEIINDEYILTYSYLDDVEVEFNYEEHGIYVSNHDDLIENGFEINYLYNKGRVKPIEHGIYNVTAIITKDNIRRELTSNLTINRKHIHPHFDDTLFEVGQNYDIELKFEGYINIEFIYYNLNFEIIDKPTEVGRYIVKPIFDPLHDNYIIEEVYTYFDIILSRHDMNVLENTYLENNSYVYNAHEHKILLSTHNYLLSHGFEVIYETYVDSGIYEYNVLIKKGMFERRYSSILEITKKVIEPNFNEVYILEGNDYEFSFDINIQTNITYKYYLDNEEISKPSKPGIYKVNAIFEETSNYIINECTYSFEIIKNYELLLNDTYIANKVVEYNYNEVNIYVSNHEELIENGFSITYYYNGELLNPINYGTYNVLAIIEKEDIYYTYDSILEITKKVIDSKFYGSVTITEETNYDFNFDYEAIVTYYENDNIIDKPYLPGSYTLKAKFINYNENYYVNDLYVNYEIIFNEFHKNLINSTILNSRSFVYNEQIQYIYLNNHGQLSEKFNIDYIYSEDAKNVGIYNVIAVLNRGQFYKEYTATIEITRKELNPQFIEIDILEGDDYEIIIDSNTISSEIIVDYSYYQDNILIDKPTRFGVYKIKTEFSNTDNFIVNDISLIFKIKRNYQILLDESFIENLNVEYDYNEQNMYLSNHDELVENGFIITYLYNDELSIPVNFGIYNVLVIVSKDELYKEFESTLEITKKIFSPIITSSDIIEGMYYTFDIEEESIPSNINYTFRFLDIKYNIIPRPSSYGTYITKVEFNNYNENYFIVDTYYEFKISLSNYLQSLVDNAFINELTFEHDGNIKYALLSNHIDLSRERFTITYLYNDSTEYPIEVGSYNVRVIISKNDNIIRELSSILNIV